MRKELKIVAQIPLTHLWKDQEDLCVKRERNLTQNDIREILKQYPIEFVIADIGSKLKWISVEKCYEFWKSEVQGHLVDNQNKDIYLEGFSKEYAYFASEWTGEIQTPIILLEKHH